jgi:hypothetical protein
MFAMVILLLIGYQKTPLENSPKGPLKSDGYSPTSPMPTHIGQGLGTQYAVRGLFHFPPQAPEGAQASQAAPAFPVVADAIHGRRGSVQSDDSLPERDLVWRLGQGMPAMGAAQAAHETGSTQCEEQLVEIGGRDLLSGGDVGTGNVSLSIVLCQIA